MSDIPEILKTLWIIGSLLLVVIGMAALAKADHNEAEARREKLERLYRTAPKKEGE